MNIGQRIKERREELGLTQDELAKKVGYKSRSSINKIELSRDLPLNKVEQIARALDTTPSYIMGWDSSYGTGKSIEVISRLPKLLSDIKKKDPIIVPILGRVAAGIPIEMVDNVIDTEELDPNEYKPGNYFGLKIKGNSMEPKIEDGDVIIVRQQDDVESGQFAVVAINGEDATCKKVMKHENGIMLVSLNPQYPPKFFSNEEIISLPVKILGKVVESRCKFE